MEGLATAQDVGELYQDISACLLALANALEESGVLTREQLQEAAQERLLAMQPAGPDEQCPAPLRLLKMLATGVTRAPKR